MRVVGIDLGTTNSVVAFVDENGEAHAIADESGSRITPSVVYFPSGEDRMEVGALAQRQSVLEPDRVARLFKRGMGLETFLPDGSQFMVDGKELRPELLSSFVIRKLVNVAELHLGETVSDVVITVPAYFGEAERTATQSAGEIAGMTVHLLPAEPMAAAVAFGLEEPGAAGTILVFDLGGGTFDVTVLRRDGSGELQAVAHEGNRTLGGADFDQLIVNRMAVQAATEVGADLASDPQDLASAQEAAEEIKKELSTRDKAETALIVGGSRVRFELTRSDFEGLIAHAVEDTELTVERALDAAGLTAQDIDQVLMVGGSSRIPAFKEMLAKYFGKDPLASKNLDEDVARGAALMGTLRLGLAPTESALSRLPAPRDISSHGLGIEALDESGNTMNVVMLPSGTPLPLLEPVKHTFGTASNNQQEIQILIYEGDQSDIRFVEELGRGMGRFDQPKPINHPINVEMSLTEAGTVHVTASDGLSGSHLCDVEVHRKTSLSAVDMAAGTEMLNDFEVF